MTQSVIVYRNPLEAALWENGFVFPILAASLVGVITFVLLHKAFDGYNRSHHVKGRRNWQPTKFQVWMSALMSLAVGTVVLSALIV